MKNMNLWLIMGIVLLNSIGYSIVLPLLPFLIGKYLPAQQIVVGMSVLMSVFAACTFLSAPVFGALSDRFGRKIILLISLMGSAIGFVLFGAGGSFWLLLLGRIIDGLTAGNISTLFAYISDVTKPEERTKWYSYIGAFMGIGKIGGPALGGLLGSINFGLPFFLTAGLIFLSALGVYFLMPESLSPDKRTKQLKFESINTFAHFKDIFNNRAIKLLLFTGMLFYAAITIFQFNFTIFLKDIYKWDAVIIGSLLTLVGICEILIRAWILPFLLKRFQEKRIGFTGLIILGTGLILILINIYFHSFIVIVLAVIAIISGEGLFEPIYTGRLSTSVNEDKQGKLQGVNQSLISVNNILIPLFGAVLYIYSPWILYFLATLLVLSALVLIIKPSQKD